MTTIRDAVAALETIAPLTLAEGWDNVGLLLGDAAAPLAGPIVLTIDLTPAVFAEARVCKAGMIIAYHPPIFSAIKRLVAHDAGQRTILEAARTGVAIYSPHTALDACRGGITDWLCEILSGGSSGQIVGDCKALRPAPGGLDAVKIVTFVPEQEVDKLRDAMASAGAGIIGAYTRCSFALRGEGTFEAGLRARPAAGRAGEFSRVSESRLEMQCAKQAVPIVLETLRRFHPYEEPAVDVYELLEQPRRGIGAGRRLTLDHPTTLAELAQRLEVIAPAGGVAMSNGAGNRRVSSLGVVPGAGASLLDEAAREKCEVFVTGEMKHHDVLAAHAAGLSVLLGGHTATERGYMPRYAEKIRGELGGVDVIVSRADVDPLTSLASL
jgi:dinuclear metal center YbgI/SA1388 family protein